ncbi:hypothetical protein TSUD_232300 [Trifolium subterraneum]|uniref:Retrotransposon gag domain-containing protein n=1 Tax=Trifolium subterraneum TaxID=3900 RepID=A0A2Z6M659_TRISU|nr:hypothetical protein TSUD_232300 [Trifolium subterraneum]
MVGKEEEEHHPFAPQVLHTSGYPYIHHKIPKIELYDGTTDPEEHLEKFRAHMLLQGFKDGIMCRVFACTLTGPAIRWFFSLPPYSIYSFPQLAQAFLSRFVLSKTYPKLPITLKCLKQRTDESLQDYLYRFNQEAVHVDNLSNDLCIHLIQAGLKPGSFKESLVTKPLLNLDDLWKRAACFVDPDVDYNKPQTGGRWNLCLSD